MAARRWLALLLALLLVGSFSVEAQAAAKKKKNISYFGSVEASGQWQTKWDCGMHSYASIWQLQGFYGKARIEPAGELNMTLGGASGRIDWNVDQLCNGNLETGSCSVGLDDFILPVFLEKAKGGVKVDFQLSLIPVGCGTAQVYPYGVGTETIQRTTREPQGFIPNKKIGKKVITVPLSGNDSGFAVSRSFTGQMSGTLRLTRKKPIQTLPF